MSGFSAMTNRFFELNIDTGDWNEVGQVTARGMDSRASATYIDSFLPTLYGDNGR